MPKLIDDICEYLEYDPDTGILRWKKRPSNRVSVGSVAGTDHGNGYISVGFRGRNYFAHRLAFALMAGQWPDQVDHINGVRSDNRWENLRDVDHKENHRNQRRRKNNTSGTMGVNWSPKDNCWRAYITVDGRQQFLGHFAQKREAISARQAQEAQLGFHEGHGK